MVRFFGGDHAVGVDHSGGKVVSKNSDLGFTLKAVREVLH